jgi:hypothetical protein
LILKRNKGIWLIIRIFAALIGCLVLTTAVMGYMGYNVIELIRNAINSPDRTAIGNNDNEMHFTGDTQLYASMSEMIEGAIRRADANMIFAPSELPIGYVFTDFEITSYQPFSEVLAYSAEPQIRLRILIGSNLQVERFNYRATNGIRYNIVETYEGLYQAIWLHGKDYYELVAEDRAELIEMIENMNIFHTSNLEGARVQIEISDVYSASSGIEYTIIQFAVGLYMAQWNYGGHYYSLTVTDREVIAEIIENLESMGG